MPAPTITSAATASTTVGTAFSFQVVASNAPSTYKAEYLPPQMQINPATGLISGTAEVSGTFQVNLYASNASGTSDPFVLTITAAPVAAQTGSTLVPVPPSTNPAATTSAATQATVGGTPRVSQGPLYAIPTTTANGTELGNRPSATNGVEVYMPTGASLSYYIDTLPIGTAPVGPPNGEVVQLMFTGSAQSIRCSIGDRIIILASTLGTGAGTPHINWRWIQT